MITVKQYADERGITIQAVHQSMAGKRKKDRLQGHVQVIDGIKWLDEEAVAILDESRNKSPVVYEKADANERIQELEREKEQMLLKIAAQADKISELAQWKADNALAISSAAQTQLLLETTRGELDQVKADLVSQTAESENAHREAAEAAQRAAREILEAQELAKAEKAAREAAEAELAAYKALPWYKKLRRN